jgi:uncharacterized protein YbjT (DUF2867 family)
MLVRDVSRAQSTIQSEGIPADEIEFVQGDVTDIDSLKKSFASKDVGYVISSIGSLWFDAVDGKGNINLVDAAKDAGVDGFILISSTSVTRTWSFLNLVGLAKPKLRCSSLSAENQSFHRSNSIFFI